MTVTETLRLAFAKDVEDAMEQLCYDIAHLDDEESVDDIMRLLYALRIAAIAYGERTLQKQSEQALALMLNHRLNHSSKTVSSLYDLVETMVYPYGSRAALV
jgi:hypothetical protein